MKLLRILLYFFVIATTLKAEVLFTDNYDGLVVDTSKWNVVLPFGDSAVSQSSGSLVLEKRGGVFTKNGFNSPYELSGAFINHNEYSVLTVVLRSDETIANNDYKTANGLSVLFWGPLGQSLGGRIDIRGDDPLAVNWGTDIAVNPEAENSFKITDSGTSIKVEFNGSLLVDYQTTFSLGNKIGYFSRESRDNFGPGPSRWEGNTEILSTQITNVPEPSALSLLAVGLGGLVLLRQGRKKD